MPLNHHSSNRREPDPRMIFQAQTFQCLIHLTLCSIVEAMTLQIFIKITTLMRLRLQPTFCSSSPLNNMRINASLQSLSATTWLPLAITTLTITLSWLNRLTTTISPCREGAIWTDHQARPSKSKIKGVHISQRPRTFSSIYLWISNRISHHSNNREGNHSRNSRMCPLGRSLKSRLCWLKRTCCRIYSARIKLSHRTSKTCFLTAYRI